MIYDIKYMREGDSSPNIIQGIVADTIKSAYDIVERSVGHCVYIDVINGRSVNDPINHPPHYNQSSIEVIDAIEAWGLGFNLGNSVKYIARAKHKGKSLEDLKRARWYLDREIEKLENTDPLEELGVYEVSCNNPNGIEYSFHISASGEANAKVYARKLWEYRVPDGGEINITKIRRVA